MVDSVIFFEVLLGYFLDRGENINTSSLQPAKRVTSTLDNIIIYYLNNTEAKFLFICKKKIFNIKLNEIKNKILRKYIKWNCKK